MQTFKAANLKIMAAGENSGRICYVLYPLDDLSEWIEEAAERFDVTIATVTGMDWSDDLTPWPAPGEPPGCPPFRGRAPEFLDTLTSKVLPEVERRLGISSHAERTLCGVSLSGLFTLWQWMLDDTFHNIISLSGSFWYAGFASWITSQPAPRKSGRAYFLLGNREAYTKVKAFQPVQTDTERIVAYLKSAGIGTTFELVPGDHYQYPEQRLMRSFTHMFSASTPRS